MCWFLSQSTSAWTWLHPHADTPNTLRMRLTLVVAKYYANLAFLLPSEWAVAKKHIERRELIKLYSPPHNVPTLFPFRQVCTTFSKSLKNTNVVPRLHQSGFRVVRLRIFFLWKIGWQKQRIDKSSDWKWLWTSILSKFIWRAGRRLGFSFIRSTLRLM